jgi:hypothetical protein
MSPSKTKQTTACRSTQREPAEDSSLNNYSATAKLTMKACTQKHKHPGQPQNLLV